MFEANLSALSNRFDWGYIGILPWDTEVFGFAVGEYRLGDAEQIAENRLAFQQAFAAWALEHRVELASCSVPGDDVAARALLPRLGFVFVDLSLVVTRKIEENDAVPDVLLDIAAPSDQSDLERIAGQAFRFGRYHADARFPRELADRRYQFWAREVLAARGPDSVTYVARRSGRVVGFEHVQYEDERAYITILAIDRELQGIAIGHALGDMVKSDFKRRGIRQVESKVSALNSSVINHALARGYRFSTHQVIYHWHAPQAPHLFPWEKIHAAALR